MDRIAIIDIGTVTARLAVADVDEKGVAALSKTSTICNLGQDVDATGMLRGDACRRVADCVAGYVATAREAGAKVLCCTLTSAARDAGNAAVLLDGLAALGVRAQVIGGSIEGSLTFLGVARDFVDRRILVADNGGGSTELALGSWGSGALALDFVRSIDVGCRRITERHLAAQDPPTEADLAAARAFCVESFSPALADAGLAGGDAAPVERLVVTGGTATTLAAVSMGLVPYDSARVHLHELPLAEVTRLESLLAGLAVAERAKLPGIQPQRAAVILGGTVILRSLMEQLGVGSLTVSESDLLYGMSLVVGAVVRGEEPAVSWRPELSYL